MKINSPEEGVVIDSSYFSLLSDSVPYNDTDCPMFFMGNLCNLIESLLIYIIFLFGHFQGSTYLAYNFDNICLS